jgi:aconitate hydratase
VRPRSTALDSGSLVLALFTRLSWRTTPCELQLFVVKLVILLTLRSPGGLIIGTDSHTPNAGGMGMLGVGVGGADAVDAMTSMPWELQCPRIIGVKLTGQLSGWTSTKGVLRRFAA